MKKEMKKLHPLGDFDAEKMEAVVESVEDGFC